jgi:hypothetical protein
MPVVPRYQDQVSPQGLPGVDVPTTVPDGALGNPQGITAFNKPIAVSMQVFAEEKKKADELATQKAYDESIRLKNALEWDPQSGAMLTKGENSFGVIDQYKPKLEQGYDAIESRLTPAQQEIFKPIRMRLSTDFESGLQRHIAGETKRYEIEQFQSTIQVTSEDTILNAYTQDPQVGIGRVRQATQRFSAYLGLPSAKAREIELQEVSKLNLGLIKKYVDDGSIALARQHYAKATSRQLPQGMHAPGNLDLSKRPNVTNPEGGYSTVFSMGISRNGKEIVIPRVVGDKILSPEDAIKHFDETGENLGEFDSRQAADEYAKTLHEDQEMKLYGDNYVTPSSSPTGLTAQDSADAKQLLDKSGTKAEAQALTFQIVDSSSSLTEARKKVREATGDNVELYDETMQRVEQGFYDRERARQLDGRKRFQSAMNKATKYNDPDAIPDSEWFSLEPEQQQAIIQTTQQLRNNRFIQTNQKRFGEIMDELSDPRTQVEAAKKDYTIDRPNLSDGDYAVVEDLAAGIRQQEKKALDSVNKWLTTSVKAKSILESNGIDTSPDNKIDADKTSEFIRVFHSRAMEEQSRTGRWPDDKWLTETLDTMMMQVEKSGSWYNDPDVRYYQVKPNEKLVIPDDVLKRIDAGLRARKIPITEKARQERYRYFLEKSKQ